VRLPERDPPGPHQPVGEVGRGREARPGGRPHPLRGHDDAVEHGRRRGEAELERVGRVEQALLILLHVLAVGEREALERRQQRLEVAEHAAGLAADQLGRVRVALLRHDRAAGRERLGHPDEPELRRRPQTSSSASRERWTAAIAAEAR
jgi:hypothetical protein